MSKHSNYIKKLNETLIFQSHNPLFYEGNTTEGAKVLTKKVTDSIDKISKSNSDAILNSTTINNNANIPITNTDKEFLNLIGYNKAKKDIREVLDKEINSLIEKDKTFIDKLFNYFQSNSNNEKSDNNENKTANKIE